jgi:hypothetical protein
MNYELCLEPPMKLLVATIFAMSLLGAAAASADVLGAHVGPVHLGLGVGHGHGRHCEWRGHHQRHRVCW